MVIPESTRDQQLYRHRHNHISHSRAFTRSAACKHTCRAGTLTHVPDVKAGDMVLEAIPLWRGMVRLRPVAVATQASLGARPRQREPRIPDDSTTCQWE